ncbi:MAG: FtsH protease activity modulator HflK [Lachnospiraceae bacterium]|nr:FtsH protease activity modulator HflK [Lachnospiraceae bacterium]
MKPNFTFYKKKPDIVNEGGTYTDPGEAFKKIRGVVSFVIIAIIAVSVLLRCFYAVNEQENAILTQFGRVIQVNTAGFYFKAPWQSVRMVDMTTHGTAIGYVIDEDAQKGQYPVDEASGIMITSDFNLLNIDFYLEYRVSDPVAYTYNTESPETILANIAQSNIRTVVSNYTVDEAMTTGKSQIQADIKEAITKELNEHDIGLMVLNITVQDSRPPTAEIVAAFKEVETAKQGADTDKNNAQAYKNRKIPEAEAEADAIIQKATAAKEARIAEAEGQVARFNEIYNEYQKYPTVTKRRMFYEKMEEILPGIKVVISDGQTQTMLPLDSFTDEGRNTDEEDEIPEESVDATDYSVDAEE